MRADKIQRFFSKMNPVFTSKDKISHLFVGSGSAEAIIKDENGDTWIITMSTPERETVET